MASSNFNQNRVRISNSRVRPLNREHMPEDFEVSFQRYTDNRAHRIPDDIGKVQSLKGFDPVYQNIVDYIIRITYRIWETDQREVEYIGECYAPDSLVFDDYGLQVGNKKIISDTQHTTKAFPNIILDAEEVIWAGDDEIGFHTSHLTRIQATNTGASMYGHATGKEVNFMVIANCVALRNDIFFEHVLYNTSAMLKQLGFDLWEEAERLATNPPSGWPRTQKIWDQLRNSASHKSPLHEKDTVQEFDPDAFTRSVHENIWNGDKTSIKESYIDNFVFEGTTDRKFRGKEKLHNYVDELRNPFPDFELKVNEVYWMGNEEEGWLISCRWSAEGTHLREGIFRSPTNKACQIWGITQWRVQNSKILQEWQLFNEFDLMMQIVSER